MPKRKRRDQQHLKQEPARRKNYALGGTAPKEIYKPTFPMNLLGNIKFFSIVGIGIAVIMVFAVLLSRGGANTNVAADLPTETPVGSVTADASASPSATADARTFAKADQVIDATKNTYTATMKTSKGTIEIKLDAADAPNTVNSFVFLAQKKFFDGLTFHRIISGFVIQGGDPQGDGSGGPGYSTNDEPNKVRNTTGTLSMAKADGASSFGSQFFINLKDNSSLDYDNPTANKFYPFATVTSGMDVVNAIAAVPVDANDKPTTPVTIDSVTITATPK
ncbi:MAG: peptidylprolyl isomerase [Tepidiformaceae bacterium]